MPETVRELTLSELRQVLLEATIDYCIPFPLYVARFADRRYAQFVYDHLASGGSSRLHFMTQAGPHYLVGADDPDDTGLPYVVDELNARVSSHNAASLLDEATQASGRPCLQARIYPSFDWGKLTSRLFFESDSGGEKQAGEEGEAAFVDGVWAKLPRRTLSQVPLEGNRLRLKPNHR